MIAPLKRPLRFETLPLATLTPRDRTGSGGAALAVGLLGFFCMIPYPALAVGGTSALQIGNVLTLLLALPVLAMSWKGRAFWIYPAILLPMIFSAVKVGVVGGGDLGICIKTMVMWALSCMTLLIPQLYARRNALPFLTGVAIATLLHAAMGFWQVYSFSSGVFPFPGLYINQSFLSVQENAEIIAKYTQRPFGLFPEPSAMSSSLAPWVLFWGAQLCGIVRLKQQPARWQKVLFGAAAASGLALIILSQSGHAAVTVAALLLFAVIWFVRCGATVQTYGIIVLVMGVVLPAVLWFAAISLSNRVGGSEMGNSSWEERTASLKIGFSILVHGDGASAICGVGMGHMAPALWNVAQIDAVFSVLLTYVYETGLIGLLAVGAIGFTLIRMWKRSAFSVAFGAIAGVWLVGITLTTSYEQLLSLWLVLGWLTVWPEFCEIPVKRVVGMKRPESMEETIAEPGVDWNASTVEGSARLGQRWMN